jgi:hypothetical protein
MKKVLLLAVALIACAIWACGSDNGTVRIIMTDKPVDGVEQLNVTISKVEVHIAAKETADGTDDADGGKGNGKDTSQDGDAGTSDDEIGWRVVTDEVQTFDLLKLRSGVTTLLGEGEFPEGKITQIRLILDKAEAVVNGAKVPVDCPASCGKTGIKIVTRGGLDVTAGKASEITLDFVADESLKDDGKGGYRMEHVIKVLKQEQK